MRRVIELEDFRGKLTVETLCVLKAEARASGTEMQIIVREILSAWALKKIHSANLLHNQLRAKGVPGIGDGTSGSKE